MSTATFTVIQAEAHGVTGTRADGTPFLARRLDQVAPDGWIRLVRPPAAVDRALVLEFGRGEVGAKYGALTILSTAIDKVTPSSCHLPFRRPGTWICSALAAEALRLGGWHHGWPDIYQVTPADLMHTLVASGGAVIDVADALPGDIGFAHSKGLIAGAIRFAQRGEADSSVNHAFILDRQLNPAA